MTESFQIINWTLEFTDLVFTYLLLFLICDFEYQKNRASFWIQLLLIFGIELVADFYFDSHVFNEYWIIFLQIGISLIIFRTRYIRIILSYGIFILIELLSSLVCNLFWIEQTAFQPLEIYANQFEVPIFHLSLILMDCMLYLIIAQFKMAKQNKFQSKAFHQLFESRFRLILLMFIAAFVGIYLFVQFSPAFDQLDLFFTTGTLLFEAILLYLMISYQKKIEISKDVIDLQTKLGTKEEQVQALQNQHHQIQHLFTTLRAERHDFINHVQVIQGLVRLNRIDKVTDYLKQLGNEIKDYRPVIIQNNPYLSALLQTKMIEAEHAKIALQLSLADDLSEANWQPTEMNVVIGNILNNAIEAFENTKVCTDQAEKQIWVRTKRVNHDQIELIIGNNATPIPEKNLSKIERSGFTTKKNHSGVGLASVSHILRRISGKMTVSSYEGFGTEFRIWLPCIQIHSEKWFLYSDANQRAIMDLHQQKRPS